MWRQAFWLPFDLFSLTSFLLHPSSALGQAGMSLSAQLRIQEFFFAFGSLKNCHEAAKVRQRHRCKGWGERHKGASNQGDLPASPIICTGEISRQQRQSLQGNNTTASLSGVEIIAERVSRLRCVNGKNMGKLTAFRYFFTFN